MFSQLYRERARDRIIDEVKADKNILSAASIGSYARNEVDRWSDIDLTFGIDSATSSADAIEQYKKFIKEEFQGEFLFKISLKPIDYIVFLLPGCLQIDLSFSPQNHFGPLSEHFELLFGTHGAKPEVEPPSEIKEKFGLIVHHLLRSYVSLKRKQIPKAVDWLSKAQKYAMSIESNKNNEVPIFFDELKSSNYRSSEEIQSRLNQCIKHLPSLEHKNPNKLKRITLLLEELEF